MANSKTKTIAVINETKILVVENGQKLVPIKPICEALGVAFQSQKEKIENDDILASTVTLSITVAADGKQREMFCIPFKYVFGWLFTINSSNVKEEAREAVIRYKLACYDALYQNFTDTQEFLEDKQSVIEERLSILDEAKKNFKTAKTVMENENKLLNRARQYSFEDWQANNRQMDLFIS